MKKETIFELLQMVIGCFLMAIGFVLFFDPKNIAPGGITGLSIVISEVTKIPLSLINLSINIPLFLIAYKILSKKECGKTILGIILFSASLKIVEMFPELYISDDMMLISLFGSAILGIGLGIIIRIDGTTGGTDLIGVIMNKLFPQLKAPMVMGFADCIVVLLSCIITGSIEIGLYSGLSAFLVSNISNLVVDGLNTTTTFMIITEKSKEISDIIIPVLDRGATSIKGEGCYTGREKDILMVVVSKKQIVKLKKIVKKVDPSAFIITFNNNETIGEGFKNIYVQ